MQEAPAGSPKPDDDGVNPILVLFGAGALAGIVMALFTILGPQSAAQSAVTNSVQPTPIPDPVRVTEPAPDFTGISLDGEAITLSDLRGRPVAINFWATWCGPCRVEMPALQSASEQYSEDEFVLLAVNAGETEEQVRRFIDELDLTFTVIVDREEVIVDQYLVRVFPTTVWIDADGNVVAEHFGPLSENLIERYLTDLLS